MKAILSITIVALLSTMLAGCWFYSRHDPEAGCQKTTYGILIASTSTEDCGGSPPASAAPQSPTIAPAKPPSAVP